MDNGPLGSRFPASYTWPVGLGHIHFDIAHLVRGTVILFPLMKVDQNLNHSCIRQEVFLYRKIQPLAIDEINNIQIHAKYHHMGFLIGQIALWPEVLGNTQSNKSDANVEDSDCTVQMLLFISILLCGYRWIIEKSFVFLSTRIYQSN